MREINCFKLEKDLIPPNKWKSIFNEMPSYCQNIANKGEGEGIGWNLKYGWFIMYSCGQGPVLAWYEKENINENN